MNKIRQIQELKPKLAMIWQVDAGDILRLRRNVLYQDLPIDAARFKGDDEIDSLHIAVCHPASPHSDGPVVCCASFIFEDHNGEPAWKLCGLCTDPENERRGFATTLLQNAETLILATAEVKLLCCAMPASLFEFFNRRGWKKFSSEFSVPRFGPHCKMIKRL